LIGEIAAELTGLSVSNFLKTLRPSASKTIAVLSFEAVIK
jgi:hypothetical protein